MGQILFRSPFPPDECAIRLKALTEPDRGGLWEDLTRTHAVLARLKGQKVRLRVRRAYTRNAFAPIFYGRFEATPGGTLLRGRFRTNPAVLAFVVVWIFVLNLGPLLALLTRDNGVFANGGSEIKMLMLSIGFLAALIWFLRRLGRADKQDILRTIRDTLNATTHDAAD
jgi:hypothetical protein